MKNKEKSTVSWIYEFAGKYRSSYIISIVLSFIGVAFSVLPFWWIARMIQQLLSHQTDESSFIENGVGTGTKLRLRDIKEYHGRKN